LFWLLRVRLGGNGNLVVKVEVDVPKTLGDEHAELLKKLADIEKVNVSSGIADFNEKTKAMYDN
jgi:DnaJ-class molecular chaperone